MKIISNKIVFFSLLFIFVVLLVMFFYPTKSGRNTSFTELKTVIADNKGNKGRIHYEKGANFLDQKKYDDCIRESEIAIKLNPKLDGAYCNLGGAFFMKGDYDKALFYLKKAFEINPNREATKKNLSIVCNSLGADYLVEGKYSEALKMFLESVKLNPKNSETRIMLGNAHHLMGSLEMSLQEYEEASKIDPNNALLYGLIGSTYIKLKLYDKAIEAFKKGISVDPNNAKLHYELGVTYYDKGLINEAIEEIKLAKKIDPDDKQAEKVLSSLENIKTDTLNLNNYTLDGELNKFLLTRKETVEDALSREVVFLDIPQPITGKAIAYALPISTALDFIGHLFFSNRYEDVGTFSQMIIKKSPNKIYPYYKEALSLEALGKIDEAINKYKKMKELFPDFPPTCFRLYCIYKYDKGDSENAENELVAFKNNLGKADNQTQREIQSFIINDSFSIGSYHLNISRQMDKAIKEFSALLELAPEKLELKYNLATSYINKGSKEENRDIFFKGIQILKDIIKSNPESSIAALADQQIRKRQEEDSKMFLE